MKWVPWSPFYRWVNKGTEKLHVLVPSHKVSKWYQSQDLQPEVADCKAQRGLSMTHPQSRSEATSLIHSSGQMLGRENLESSWGQGPSSTQSWWPVLGAHQAMEYLCCGYLEERYLSREHRGPLDVQRRKLRPREATGVALLVSGIVSQASWVFCDSRGSPSPFFTAKDQQWKV